MCVKLQSELEKTREELSSSQKTKAQARWNLSVNKEKVDAIGRKLKFQGELRKQLVAKATEERDILAAELVREKEEMKKAVELIRGLETELEKEREDLTAEKKSKAQARWNLGANKEKAEALARKLQFQGGVRKQLVEKTVEEREALVNEVVRERKEAAALALSRVETVEQLKEQLTAQIDAVLGDLRTEMGSAQKHAKRKSSAAITKVALEKKESNAAAIAEEEPEPEPEPVSSPKPAPPKKSGSVLQQLGSFLGIQGKEGDAAAEEPPAPAAEEAPATASETQMEEAAAEVASNVMAAAVAAATTTTQEDEAAAKMQAVARGRASRNEAAESGD